MKKSLSPKFTRVKEDFVCQNCGLAVKGTGYTNHCPQCLWSKHVDNNPGDRQNSCQGLMKPIGLEMVSGQQKIIHCCQQCGLIKRNLKAQLDNFETILSLAKQE